ncbi:MAG: RagB/SusD family nutrient uptake outer membrane protein [Gemmatimonadota bacterium]|nr:RagB/SusD family nutrient uptake outer membrane protein [Gemmatimonadota bacterium]HEU4990452.1 RagB/SusD family nutrient uptake outer membrane protein [Gemmatimonadaceae bacterium]
MKTHILQRWPAMLCLAAGFLAVSCTNLSETPYDQVTTANFHPTAQDMASLIAPAYTPLRAMWMQWYGALDLLEETGDEFLTPVRPNGWYDGGIYIQQHKHRWTPYNGQESNLWNQSFAVINSANRVIFQIDSGVVPTDAATKTAIVSELRAVRAYAYYMLLDNFGNVPIVTDFKQKDLPQQSTRQQVYDFVVKELTDVIPNLPDATGQAMYGRMNKWAALALLARVYLNAEVYTGTPAYDKVIPVTQQIIDAGRYQLDADYRMPFSRNNQNSREIIFAVPYDAVNGRCSQFHMKTLKPDLEYVFNLQAQPWGGSASNPQFIATYDTADVRLKDTWLMGPQFDGQGRGYNFTAYVPRIDSTGFNNGFPVWKYEIYAGETGCSDVDYPVIRYAEVLMMQAEALLRLGNADAAAALVTQVRQRDFPTDPAKATVTGAELQQGSVYNYGWYDTDGVVKTGPGGTPVTNGGADVKYGRFLDELGWEFAIEGHTRTDMIRFGVYTTKSWFNHAPDNNPDRRLFAIPQGAINTNSNLKQNPGY